MTTTRAKALNAALDTLDQLRRRPPAKPRPPPLDQLRRRATTALNRAETARHRHDGWPTGADPGPRSTYPSSPTETTVINGGPRDLDDPVTHHAHQAITDIITATTALTHALTELDRLDALADTAPTPTPNCESCARTLEHPRPPAHYGDLNTRLPRPMHLCAPCHQFTDRTGYLPTLEQLHWHHGTGRWRIRDTGRTPLKNGER